MIRSFRDRDTERFFQRQASRSLPADIQRAALRKLVILDAAELLQDLRLPPGNRLEPLKGNLRGMHSIRVNDQWRLVFRWTDTGPVDVDVVDYH